MPPPISMVIITRNEEKDLPGCLESVKGLVSEIVLVDNNSSDKTVEIARHAGADTSTRIFDDFSSQKNFALGRAKFDWVLHLDADERISPELRGEILERFSAGEPASDAYMIPYSVIFMGKQLRYSGVGSERHLRLFRKSKSGFTGGVLHEGICTTGRTAVLRGKIIHRPYADMREYLEKLNRYTTLAAEKAFVSQKRYNPLRLIVLPLEFIKRYFLRLGVLDGAEGFIWCALASFYVWIKAVKLRELRAETAAPRAVEREK